MAYVITQKCVSIKDASCVEVCPVDCIQPTPGTPEFEQAEQLYINPDDCIECGACKPVCPSNAVFADEDVPQDLLGDIAANASYFSASA